MTKAVVPKLQRGQHLAGAQRSSVGAHLLREYQAGKSIRELRDETGYSIGRIRRLLLESGVEFRSRGGATRSRKTG